MYQLYVLDKIRKGRAAVEHGTVVSSEDLKRENGIPFRYSGRAICSAGSTIQICSSAGKSLRPPSAEQRAAGHDAQHQTVDGPGSWANGGDCPGIDFSTRA